MLKRYGMFGHRFAKMKPTVPTSPNKKMKMLDYKYKPNPVKNKDYWRRRCNKAERNLKHMIKNLNGTAEFWSKKMEEEVGEDDDAEAR